MMITLLRSGLLLFFLSLISLNASSETQKKVSAWEEAACSSRSFYIQKNPNSKRIHVPANMRCETRSQLLGFDSSLCGRCKKNLTKDRSSSRTTTPSSSGGETTTGSNPGGGTSGSNNGAGETSGGHGTDSPGSGETEHPNNGHGNDPDHNDSSNPGHSNNGDNTDADGSPGKEGHGKGVSK